MSKINGYIDDCPMAKREFNSKLHSHWPTSGNKKTTVCRTRYLPAPSSKASITSELSKVSTLGSRGDPLQKVSKVPFPSEASEVSSVGNLMLGYLGRYIGAGRDDLVVVVLWILHAPVFRTLVTTPRLLITSILPESGKSTLVDWIKHLCQDAIAMSSVSSAALLARLAAKGRPLLVDEADRSLRRDNPLTADFIAISNSGYKDGGSRPTLQPTKDGGWEATDLSTWCPMVFAGNNPDLPDDTRSRCILIYLYPSDTVEDTDWELIEQDDTYQRILTLIPQWAGQAQDRLTARPGLDPRVKGRVREKWLPLARVAQTLDDYPDEAGRPVSWLDTVRRLAVADVEQLEDDAALGLRNSSPHTAILTDIARLWATQWADQPFIGSTEMCNALATTDPTNWGTGSKFGTPITPRRLAGMLKKTGVNATRNKDQSRRGYYFSAFHNAWKTLKVWQELAKESIIRPQIDTLDKSDTLDTLKERPECHSLLEPEHLSGSTVGVCGNGITYKP